jgi:hypothetical protein
MDARIDLILGQAPMLLVAVLVTALLETWK